MVDLLHGKALKNLVLFTLPILFGNVLQQMYHTADSIIAGRFLGTDVLAAVGASQPIAMVLIALIIGLNLGTEILLSQAMGMKDDSRVRHASYTLFYATMTLSIVIGLAGVLFAEEMLILLQTPETIRADATHYLRVYFLGLPGLTGYNTLNGMIRSMGDTKTPLAFLALASLLNILLDIALVTMLHMRVEGLALATVLSESVAFLLCFQYIIRKKPLLSLLPGRSRFRWELLGRGLHMGLPIALAQIAISVGTLLVQVIVNQLSSTAILSAYLVGSRVDSFVAMPVTSLGIAVVTIIGQCTGARKRCLARCYERYGKRFAVCFGLLMSVLMWRFGSDIIGVFVGQQEAHVIALGSLYLRRLSLAYGMACYFTVAHGVMNGGGHLLPPIFISVMCMWLIRIPLAFFFTQADGFEGVCNAIPISWAVAFLLTIGMEFCLRHDIGKEVEICEHAKEF